MTDSPTLLTDIDPQACAHLRALPFAADVLERDVRAIASRELEPYRHVHFFAGLGAWAWAADMAGWPEDEEVWTASLPCQPFSNAGLKLGEGDERHLWPAFLLLVAARMPRTIFGEQVCSPEGRVWARGVVASLRELGYDAAWFDLPCSAVGLPHARPRIWWVATLIPEPDEPAGGHGEGTSLSPRAGAVGSGTRPPLDPVGAGGARPSGAAAVGGGEGRLDRDDEGGRPNHVRGVADPDVVDERGLPGPVGGSCGQEVQAATAPGGGGLDAGRESLPARRGAVGQADGGVPAWLAGQPHPRFGGGDVLVFADGAARLVEPGIAVLAPRVPGAADDVRLLGNALSPTLAAEFIGAFMRVRGIRSRASVGQDYIPQGP